MKKKPVLQLLLCMITILSSCGEKESEEYTGVNSVYLESEKEPVLTVGDNQSIVVSLKTVHRATRDTPFQLEIKPLDGANIEYVMIQEPEVILKKGEREVFFHIISRPGVYPDASTDVSQYEINIAQMPDEHMEFKKAFRFRFLSVPVPKLNENQLKLIEGYKARGIDLTPFLGKVRVKATVDVPAGGLFKGFEDPWRKTYEGFSVLTLSEKATADKPVLKMTYNPMGLTEFFYYAMRKSTIEQYEIWDAELTKPQYKEIRELINWNDKSVESFSASLDNIRIGEKQGDTYNMEYIGKGIDPYEYPITCIPFEYQYSAWDRQKKLIDEGNIKAKECHDNDASAAPWRYLNCTDISEDTIEYDDAPTPLPPPEATWNVKENKMKFHFLTSVYNAGWYITVDAEYLPVSQ